MIDNEKVSVIYDEFHAFRSIVIASKMMNYFLEVKNDETRAARAFLLGYVHDIGYFLCADDDEHNEVGGEILHSANYDYFKEVYYHGTGSDKFFSDELLLLELADITTDDNGRHIRVNEAFEHVKNVYGESSYEYKNLVKRMFFLQENGDRDTLVSIRDYFNSLAGGTYRGIVETN